MLTLKPTTKFKKDYKKMKKQGKDIPLLESIIDDLLNEKVLDEKYQDHIPWGHRTPGNSSPYIPPACRNSTLQVSIV